MKIPYSIVKLDDVSNAINPDEELHFDTETIGLYGRIRLAQFYQESWDKVLLVEWPLAHLMPMVLNAAKCVMHNAHYDITVIQGQTETRYIPKDYEDTFLLSRIHFYKKLAFSLDDVMEYVIVTGKH